MLLFWALVVGVRTARRTVSPNMTEIQVSFGKVSAFLTLKYRRRGVTAGLYSKVSARANILILIQVATLKAASRDASEGKFRN